MSRRLAPFALALVACSEPAPAGPPEALASVASASQSVAQTEPIAAPAAVAAKEAPRDMFATTTLKRSATPQDVRVRDEGQCDKGDADACRRMADRYRGYGDPAGCGVDRGRGAIFSKRTPLDTYADDAAFKKWIARACDAGDTAACSIELAGRTDYRHLASTDALWTTLHRNDPRRSGLARFQGIFRPEFTPACFSKTPGDGKCWDRDLFRKSKVDPKALDEKTSAALLEACSSTLECDLVWMMLDKHHYPADVLAPYRANAAKVLTAACLAGSCTCGQATRFVDATDPNRVDLAKLGCENGEAEACFVLGTLHESGSGVPKDEALARRLYELACPAKVPLEQSASPRRGEYSARACARMAAYYDEGAVPPKDDARAFFYLDKGCPAPGLAIDHEACVKVARYWLTTARNTGRNDEDAGLYLRRKDECKRPSVAALCEQEMKALVK